MKGIFPSPAEERWLHLASRLGGKKPAPFIAQRIGGWRTTGFVARCAFFVLGIIAGGAVAGIMALLTEGSREWRVGLFIGGLILIATAEFLILARRIFASGIEEALELAALFCLLISLIDVKDFVIAVVASVALAVAGLRLLNPLFTTAAAGMISVAIQLETKSNAASSLFCFAVAALALALSAIRINRPSHDHMIGWLVVTMPLAGYLWSAGDYSLRALDYWQFQSSAQYWEPLAPFVFGLAALAFGLLRRSHAALIAFMICMGCVGYELRELSGMRLEIRLIVWGIVILGAAVAIDRMFRTPRRGLTSTKLTDHEGPLDLLQLAGAAVLTTAQAKPEAQPAGFQPGGGQFGGGGSSGSY